MSIVLQFNISGNLNFVTSFGSGSLGTVFALPAVAPAPNANGAIEFNLTNLGTLDLMATPAQSPLKFRNYYLAGFWAQLSDTTDNSQHYVVQPFTGELITDYNNVIAQTRGAATQTNLIQPFGVIQRTARLGFSAFTSTPGQFSAGPHVLYIHLVNVAGKFKSLIGARFNTGPIPRY